MRRPALCVGLCLAPAIASCAAPAIVPPAPALAQPAPPSPTQTLPPAPRSPLPQPALVLQQRPVSFEVLDLGPRGELLAVADGNQIVVLRYSDRSVVARLTDFDGNVSAISFAAGGRALVGSSDRGEIRRWDIEADAALASFHLDEPNGPNNASGEPATSLAVHLSAEDVARTSCAKSIGHSCRSLRWTRLIDGRKSEWLVQAQAYVSAQPVTDSDALLLEREACDAGLLEPDGAITTIGLPYGSHGIWARRMSPDGGKLALSTEQGILMWDRATQSVTAIPMPAAQSDRPPPTLSWRHDGKHFITFDTPLGMPDPQTKTDGYLFDAAGGAPIRLDPGHEWSHVSWHPSANVVYLNSGWGSMYMLSWWVGSEVSVYRTTDGRPMGKLHGHTVTFSPSGKVLILSDGHPSRSRSGASTELIDAKTQRSLLTVPGSIAQWAHDESWFVTARAPFASSNASAGPTTYTLYAFPGGQKGTVVTDGSVTVDPRTAELQEVEESWENGALESQSHGAFARVTNHQTGTALDIYATSATDRPYAPCKWLLVGPDGALDGDGRAFFKMREQRDFRIAPLTDPEPLLKSRHRPGLYQRMITPRL